MCRSTRVSGLVAGVALGVVLTATVAVFARGTGPDSGNRLIPYSGHLERDGIAVSAARVPMKFVLEGGSQTWSYGPVEVNVYSGVFSVLIGETLPVPAWVFSEPSVTIAVEVEGMPLAGKQRIVPLPYAYWAAESDRFTVANSVHLGNVGNQQGVQIYWNRSAGGNEANFVNHRGSGAGGFQFDGTVDGTSFASLLTISGSGNVSAAGSVTAAAGLAGQSVSATGSITGQDLAVTGGITASGWPVATGKYCVVKQRDFACPAGFVEASVYWDTEDDTNNDSCGGACERLARTPATTMSFCCN
jgi:hypothetical protein